MPPLFLHLQYQPKATFGLGSTSVGVELSDVAVLVVVVAAVVAGVRSGWGPLRSGRAIWACAALFLALVAAGTLHPPLWQDDYRFLTHAVTAAKFGEYALLAPALVLLLRRVEEVWPLLYAIVGWSAAASVWACLQFDGLVSELEGKRPLQREPSFVGIHDLAALSGAALAIALAVLALGPASPRERALAWVAGPAGAIGLVLSAAVAGAVGVALAAVAAVVVARLRRRPVRVGPAEVALLAGAACAGVLLMRSGDIADFAHSLGVERKSAQRDVASYVQRSLLTYIGVRIYVDHPVLGVGWQGSEEYENFRPYLADAHRRYSDVPAAGFPSPRHAWGVQNAYLQTLTDLGTVGFGALLALFGATVAVGGRAAVRAPPAAAVPAVLGLLWLLVAAGVWNGLGLVAGIPLDALTWLAVGLAGAAAAWTADARSA